ncbi:helicase associated domain-containing protein [Streptomyces mirabilis]|uniref:helicase associated domain-containing protein n=1 Tax=Streptomyces mirabilis TaxID=68239 RepID=UPI003D9F5ED6
MGQWLSNLRRPGALAEHPEWEAALKAVDEDWNPGWPAEWQRHYAALQELVRDEDQAEVLPGFTIHGMDVGKWLVKQRKSAVWQALTDGQRERLEALGVVPLPPEQEAPAKAASGAFERGVAALAQYKARTGSVTVPRAHVETVVVDGQEHSVKLGVFLSKQNRGAASWPPTSSRRWPTSGWTGQPRSQHVHTEPHRFVSELHPPIGTADTPHAPNCSAATCGSVTAWKPKSAATCSSVTSGPRFLATRATSPRNSSG